MIKKTWLKVLIICLTGALTYGLTWASSQYIQWSQVMSLVNTALVLTCGILTGFPKQES